MKRPLLFAAFLFTMISCGTPSSQTAEQTSTDSESPTLDTIMQAEELLLKEPKTKDEVKDELDTDDDGEVSKEEMKAGLDSLGQKIKAAIEAKHADMRAAQEAAKDKIKEACADDHSSDACKAVAQTERDKLHEGMKEKLEALQKELDELKAILDEVETENETI